jgi:hypothetical protein
MPVMEMEPLEMAVFRYLDWGEIIVQDRLTTEITELNSFDAHKPSFLAGLPSQTPCGAESVVILPYLRLL